MDEQSAQARDDLRRSMELNSDRGLLMRLLIAAMLAVACSAVEAGQSSTNAALMHWKAINAGHDYAVEGSGDPQTEIGARIIVRSTKEAAGKYGGAIRGIDATSLRKRTVIVSSDLKAGAGTKGVAIWMRADGVAGKLEFATSAAYPVTGGQDSAYREIAMPVPGNATSLVFGIVLSGNGTVEATRFRLRVDHQANSGAVATAGQVLDAAIAIIKENALNAAVVNWEFVVANMRNANRDASKPADVYPAIRELLAMLGDGHSVFVGPEAARQHATMGAATSAPVVKLLSGGVGYVQLPGYKGLNDDEALKFAGSVTAGIEKIAGKASGGWVVDLRNNAGGNMWPMLAALKPLLGDDALGSFKRNSGPPNAWRAGDRVKGGGVPTSVDLSDATVAVLLGPKTNSSGEAVAVAFHGRPRTRSFGQASAGRSNANASYALPDGSAIQLTTALDVDRNGIVFGGKLEPDESTAIAQTGMDPALDAATAWLSRTSVAR